MAKEINWTNNPDLREDAQNKVRELKADMAGYIYKHFKGQRYIVRDIAIHSETAEALVIYTDLDYPVSGNVWARPLEMFLSPVGKEKYPDVKQSMRFEKDGKYDYNIM